MKKLGSTVVLALAMTAGAEMRSYTWDAANPAATLGSDATITVADDAVSAMTLNVPKDDKAVLTGDALAFAASAKITIVGGGEFVFSNDVVTAGALTADGCCTNLTYTFGLLSPGESLVLPGNVPLAALKPTAGTYSYNYDKTTYQGVGVYFVHPKEDGSKTFQVQHDDGGTLRVTYCKLEDVAEGLRVTVLKYLSCVPPGGNRSSADRINGVYDYETPEGAAFIGNNGSGGALKGLRLTAQYVRAVRTVEFAGKLTAGGKISAANDAEVILGRDAIGTEFATPYDVTMGTMTFRDHGSFTNAAAVTGTNGGIVYETSDFTGDFTAEDYVVTKSYEEIDSINENGLPSSETVVFPNTSLAMITNASATIDWRYYSGSYQSDGVSRDLLAAEFVRFDTYAIAQFKTIPPKRASISYALIIRFDQRGNDVVAYKARGYDAWHTNNPLSNDPWTWPLDSPGTGGYDKKWAHVWKLTAYSATPVGHADQTTAYVNLTGTNTTEGVGLTVRPGLNRDTTLIARAAKSLPPTGGEAHVWERGALSLHANLKTGDYRLNGVFTQENPTSLNFHPGSRGLTLRQTNNSSKQVINLDGAEYLFWREDQGDISPAVTSNPNYTLAKLSLYNYVGAINFANGARMTGWAPWISGNLTPAAAVTGQAPSVLADGLTMAFDRTQGEFAVEDVTGDAQVDFTVGLLRRNNSGDGWRKTGAGTMLLSKPLNYMGLLPVSVEEGCLLLGTSNCLTNGVGVALSGGTLGFAANTVNTNAELTVTANSSLALADGATAVFGDSSAQEWTPGTRLTVTGDPTTSRLSFGANGLTAAQLKQIRWSVGGKSLRVELGDEGEIVPYVPGAVLIVR